MPSLMRATLRSLFLLLVLTSVYICIQGAIILYDTYQLLAWFGGLAE